MSAKPATLALLLLLPAAALALPPAAPLPAAGDPLPAGAPPGPGAGLAAPGGDAAGPGPFPRVVPLDVPLLVDEAGDAMTGDLAFAASAGVQFQGGRLTAAPALAFGASAVCLAGAAIPGCATGDITAVLPGFGLSGGGTSGDVTLAVEPAVVQRRVAGSCAAGSSIRAIAESGGVTCEAGLDGSRFLRRDANDTYVGGTLATAAGTTLEVGGALRLEGPVRLADATVLEVLGDPASLALAGTALVVTVGGDLEADGDIHVNRDASSASATIFFHDANNPLVTEVLLWDGGANHRFVLSDGLAVVGPIRVGAADALQIGYSRFGNSGLQPISGDMQTVTDVYIEGDLEVRDAAYKPGGGSWTSTSDARTKRDVADFEDGLEVVRRIRPVWYSYNGLAGTPEEGRHVGVLAQEMLGVAPYTVGTFQARLHPGDAADTPLYNFDPSALDFVNINAIQDLDALAAEQRRAIEALEREVRELRSLVASLAAGR